MSAEIMRRMEGRIQAGSDGGMKRKCSREEKNPTNQTEKITGEKNLDNKAKEEIGDGTVVMYEM